MAGVTRSSFGPDWLDRRLAELLPGYPRIAVCVAFSGGLDSTALLAALAPLSKRLAELRAIHVDHGINPASGRWSRHCRTLARVLHVPLGVRRVSVSRARGTSLEAAARTARYEALAAALKPGEFLLTAHHEDDQLETVLLQLMRGAGIAGLAAMPEIVPFASGWLARPLLPLPRATLERWLRDRGIPWIEDDSNLDERIDRNYLRLKIVPLLRARWPGAGAAVARSARHAAQAQRILDRLARMDVERAADGDALSVPRLRALDLDRRRNAIRFWIARAGVPLPDARRLEEIARTLFTARADANPVVEWGDVAVQRHANRLLLRPRTLTVHRSPIEWLVTRDAKLQLPGDLGTLELVEDARGPVDLDALPPKLTIRWRSGGERIRLDARGPRRALKDLLQSARVPPAERARVPLVCDGERVLIVGDLWIDAAIRAGPGSRRRGRLVWHRISLRASRT